jgi:hypothetical protein
MSKVADLGMFEFWFSVILSCSFLWFSNPLIAMKMPNTMMAPLTLQKEREKTDLETLTVKNRLFSSFKVLFHLAL